MFQRIYRESTESLQRAMQRTTLIYLLGGVWLAAAAEDELLVVSAAENVSVSLRCTAQRKPGVDYRAVRWYKEGSDPRLTGLVSRTPPTGEMRWYVDADTRISLEVPTLSLLLPPVSCSDSGVYQCYMAAPVGQQNREGRVRLTVLGCPSDPPVVIKVDTAVHSDGYLLVCGAVGLLLSALFILLLSYRSLSNALWQKSKTLGKEPCPDPNRPLEKQDLLWITTLGPAPKKSKMIFA